MPDNLIGSAGSCRGNRHICHHHVQTPTDTDAANLVNHLISLVSLHPPPAGSQSAKEKLVSDQRGKGSKQWIMWELCVV